MSVVISIRIPRELKEKLGRLNINISETVRKLLEEYVREIEVRELEEKLKDLRTRLAGKVDPVTIAELVRCDRDRR